VSTAAGTHLRDERADDGRRSRAEHAEGDGDEVTLEHAPHEGDKGAGRAERVSLSEREGAVSR
jgi:hypothetical protein